MKRSLLFLLGTGSAVLAGPCKPSPPSSHLTETVPQYEATSTGPAGGNSDTVNLPSTTGYDNPEVTQSRSDASGESSSADVPGLGSTSNWLPGWSSDSTWPGQSTPTPGASGAFTSGQSDETHDTHIIVETSSGVEGPGDGTATQTGPAGQETNTGAMGTETGIIGTETGVIGTETGVNTEPGSDGEGTETGSASVPFNTETGVQTQTGTDGQATLTGSAPIDATQTGSNTETGANGQETETGSGATETGSNGQGTETGINTLTGPEGQGTATGTVPGQETETGSDDQGTETDNAPIGTETGINTETVSNGENTATGSVPVDASQTGTETGANGQETETGAVPIDANTVTGTDAPVNTETNVDGTETAPAGTETGPDATGTVPGATETGSNGENTETNGAPTGANTDSLPTQSGSETDSGSPTNAGTTDVDGSETQTTVAGPEETETRTDGTGPETTAAEGGQTTEPNADGSSTGTAAGPDETNTDGSEGGNTTNGSPTDNPSETSVNQPGQTISDPETDNNSGPTITDSAPSQTTAPGAGITSTPVPATTKSDGDDGITSTLTEPPADFSPTTVSNDDWTTNTWITTTSEGSDEPTVVPVLVGCPGCGGSGHGIVIFGFPPIPNTLFNFPKFPNLPKFSFPCIPGLTPGCSTSNSPETHEDNDDDDDDDDDQSTAEDKSTAEPSTSSEAETTTTSAEECSATEIGGSCTNCPKNIYVADDNGDVELIDDGDDILKRAAAPAPALGPGLGKRSPAEPITSIGGGICTLQKTGVQFPEYPSGPELFKADRGAAAQPSDTYYNTFKWFIGVQDATTCARSLDTVGKKDFGRTITNKKTMDHVYEKSMLRDFFTNILDNGVPTVQGVTTGTQGKINCGDLAYYTNDDPAVAGPNLLEEVYGAFPAYGQYLDDFIGMDDYTNSICKGTIATPGNLPNEVSNVASVGKVVRANTPWKNVEKWMEALLQTLEKLSIGVELWNHQEVQTVVIRQNRRIHSRFVNIDNNAKNCKQDDAVKNNVWSFSAAYQNYMNNLFDGTESYSINPIVQKAADDVIARMDINMAALQARLATLSTSEQDLVTKWQSRYAPLKTATYQVSFTWDFAYTSLKRRQDDGEEGESCAVPTTSLSESATSSAISSFTTSYISRTSQEVVTTEEPTRTTTVATPTESEWEGVCPTQWEIVVEDGKLPDGAGEKCLCKATPSLDDQSPYQPEQLDAAIGDFCDGSQTLHYIQNGIPEKINRDYYIGNKSVLSLGVQFTTLPADRCKTPAGDVVLADQCKTSLQRLKCQNKKENYGGFYVEATDDGCYLWSVGVGWSSDGQWPGAVDLPPVQGS